MGQIEENRLTKSKRSSSRKSLQVDLTPMVDLGFLLITFFVLTTSLSQPTVANLVMPKASKTTTLVKEHATLLLSLIGNDSIGWYEGKPTDNPRFTQYCNYHTLRSVIQQKQKNVASILGNASETTILIFPGKASTYKNLIDVLDEIEINAVTHYFIMDSKQ